jgi:hypothetical protein
MEAILLVGLFVLGTAASVAWTRRRAEARWGAASTVELLVTASGVQRHLADGRVEQVQWHEVAEVDVVRAERGPHAASGGVVVLYASATSGVLVPIDQLGESGVLEHLSRLPGFRVERLAAALEAQPPARTTCWRLLDDAR